MTAVAIEELELLVMRVGFTDVHPLLLPYSSSGRSYSAHRILRFVFCLGWPV